MDLYDIQNIVGIIQSLITTVAIIVGGFWGYTTFILKRGKYPKANIEHNITHRKINNNILLLSADIIIYNVGDLLLSFDTWEITLKQMLPPASQMDRVIKEGDIQEGEGIVLIQWHIIKKELQNVKDRMVIIEPGEFHQFQKHYLIHSSIETIMLSSFFKNKCIKNHNVGWDLTSVYDIKT